MLRLKLLHKWGEYGEGSVVDFGEGKGRPLIANGTAIMTDEKLVTIKPANRTIKLKLLKPWADYMEGSVIKFGESKGAPLIAAGIAERAENNAKENRIIRGKQKKPPKVETAVNEPKIDMKAETAEVTPEKTRRGRPRKVGE